MLSIVISTSCQKEAASGDYWEGIGVTTYLFEQGHSIKRIRLFYSVPKSAHATTPVVLVFHGADRNGLEYRNTLASNSINRDVIYIVPEFSEDEFPTANTYQLGNVFSNGESPSTASLRSEDHWTFSVFPQLFTFVINRIPSDVQSFYCIGHSAGAQFLHRLLLFKPNLPISHSVLSAAGWYTLPTDSIDFPYGLNKTPVSLRQQEQFLNMTITVQIGSNDNNPNTPSLRRNALADAQGTNRVDRAQFFFQFSHSKADKLKTSFNWQLDVVPGMDHTYAPAIQHAMNVLFN